MINLNEEKYQEKDIKVFNGGNAGVVKDCKVKVHKKGADENQNAPAYKIIFSDETSAEINDGIFNNFDGMSDKALDFFVRKMKHLAKVFRVELPAQVASYQELLDLTMKACKSAENNIKVNVAVAYGTKDRPKRFLEVDGFWGIQNSEDSIPVLSKNALKERPEMDDNGGGNDPLGAKNAPDTEGW